ncbi:hypothetical protein DESC_720491 [Desulfosarcina cetonica]|nr:hypothetical protein DESC_720491 [Desulfosarcina cetonica]
MSNGGILSILERFYPSFDIWILAFDIDLTKAAGFSARTWFGCWCPRPVDGRQGRARMPAAPQVVSISVPTAPRRP